MHRGRFILATVLTALLLLCASRGSAQQGFSQKDFSQKPRMAQGNLTVTVTVVASVGVVIGPDGEQRLIVANAADPSDNVSRLETVNTVALASNAGSSTVSNTLKKKKKR